MKRLIKFLSTTLLLLTLVPMTVGAVDFYVKRYSSNMGLYVWYDKNGNQEPLGNWDACKSNLKNKKVYKKDGSDELWYKINIPNVTKGMKINFIVIKDGSSQSNNKENYTIASDIVCIDNAGSGDVNNIVDGSGKTFTEFRSTFYVKKVGTGQMGLYLWTDDNEKPLGEWDDCKANLNNYYTDDNGNEWYKISAPRVGAGFKIKYIVRGNNTQSPAPADFFTIPASEIVCIDWKGDNQNGADITDGNGKTFIEPKYYLIVPNENVGNTNRYVSSAEFKAPEGHKAFRLKASRERNKEEVNNDLTTVSLKLDGRQLRYDKNNVIRFYIQDADGNVFMQPKNNNDDIFIKPTRYTEENNIKKEYKKARNGVDYYAARSGIFTSNQDRYYNIHKNDANGKDAETGSVVDTKTLVFMFSKYNAAKTAHVDDEKPNMYIAKGNSVDGNTTDSYAVGKNGNLIVGFLATRGVGSDYYEKHIKNNGVYLVGCIAEDGYKADKNHPMDKRYWKDGRIVELSELNGDEAKADSIVYNCLVRNTGRSWDKFFLSFSTGDVVTGSPWNLLLRPCVQDQMDAQELGGGVMFYQNDYGDQNNGQSINPLLTTEQQNRYVSYRIYFNATYSTYRVELNEGMYIAGPAVIPHEKDKEWNGLSEDAKKANSGTCFDATHRYAMRKVTIKGEEHYIYMGYFRRGGSFAFLVNNETTKNNYSEDANALTDGGQGVWQVQAPGEGGDYAFYNRVKWNDGTGGTDLQSLGNGNNAILWTLPDGYYTIRFYYADLNGPKTGKTALYTVDKNVKISNVTVTVGSEETNYGGWNVFSDDCALWMPDNIKAYYAYNVEETDGKKIVELRELKGGYIPANCGVLLRNENLTEKGHVERLNYMPIPADYTKNFEDYKTEQKINDVNLLMDCSTTDKLVELDQKNGDYYNYFFTYRYKIDTQNDGEAFDVPLNFWKVYPKAKPNKNSSYLHVKKQVTPLEFNVTDKNYYISDAATVANSKGTYCLLFSIDDVDGNETTGIHVIRPESGIDANANVWYNMQGMRVAKPTTAGIYINNGKKVVIK